MAICSRRTWNALYTPLLRYVADQQKQLQEVVDARATAKKAFGSTINVLGLHEKAALKMGLKALTYTVDENFQETILDTINRDLSTLIQNGNVSLFTNTTKTGGRGFDGKVFHIKFPGITTGYLEVAMARTSASHPLENVQQLIWRDTEAGERIDFIDGSIVKVLKTLQDKAPALDKIVSA